MANGCRGKVAPWRLKAAAAALAFFAVVGSLADASAQGQRQVQRPLPGGAPGLMAQPQSIVMRDVVVEGNQRIEASTIQSYLAAQPGEPFNEELADRSLKALFATGLFSDVNLRMQGNTLVVRVTENPVINRVVLEGNRRVTSETLNRELTLKPRQVYTRAKVQADTQRIQQIYRRSGRFAATVEPKVVQLPQNRVDLVFEIGEGPITTVGRIRFIGNRAYSDGALREQIQTKETVWWRFLSSDDNYDPDRVTFDREKLRKYYLSKGYADFRVANAVAELSPNRENFFITFTLDEGERYRLGKIDLTSELRNVDPQALRKLVELKTGDVYNADAVEKVVQVLTSELGRQGYAFVDVRPEVQKHREQKAIDVSFIIGESPRVYVERIDVVGNVRTLDKVIRREFRLVEGDAFNAAKLRRTRTRVRGLNFFDKAEIAETKGSAPDKVVLTAEVQERSTGELSFGVGYSTAEAVIGDVSIRERNLLGRGQDLRLGFSLSSRRQQVDLGFTEPYFLDRELAAGVDLLRRRTDLNRRSGYQQTTTSGTVRFGFPITEYLDDQVFYRLRLDEIDDIDPTQSRFIKGEEGSFTTSSIGNSLIYDRRDDKIEPTSGYIIKLSQELAGFGGTERFLRNVLQAGHYFPVTDEVIFNLSGETGQITSFGRRLRLPNRFFIGGDTFRGFATGGVGPRETVNDKAIGGQYYYVGTAEMTFPLGLPNDFGIRGRVFTDAGSAWGSGESGADVRDINSLRVSIGTGVSWKSPFGLIRLDLGFPLLKEEFDETEVFRINFGSRF
ncbi:outer membrane protein assembly factor BamA [Ferrovibrio sp.]|uniref:outer membrane protein assembly factor BamA n=1 Tax=Ferrovibrio sp. TaxID=1917215 RepID=UPI0025C6DB70|nr:outer membrane protein assembly factor BamA [Ferrovibrio sp.]